jgi:ferredoxin-nitrite reductase
MLRFDSNFRPVRTPSFSIILYGLPFPATHRNGANVTVELTAELTVGLIDKSIVESVSCPGLFCPTIAADGVLTRIRTPGGIVSYVQLAALTRVMERSGCSQLLITNRANIQLRSVENLTEFDLNDLQDTGLAARNPDVDHLRNVMTSPMAGRELGAFDVIPALREIERYICETPKLAALSAKFSIGIDGGERVSVRDRANDIWLVAENGRYRLVLGEESPLDIVSDNPVELVRAVADRYLQYANQVVNKSVKHRRSRKPRLRDVIECIGKERFLDGLVDYKISEDTASHVPTLGELDKTELLHSQEDPDRIALEIVCPLGKLTIEQINGLIAVLEWFDLGEIRLTPWQTLIIPNVLRSSLKSIKIALAEIPLNPNANHPARGVVACSGKSGCASAATHAQEHAQRLISQLEKYPDRSFPSIHISGCEKLCAQPRGSDTDRDIVLIGREVDGTERYSIEQYGLRYGLLCPDDAIAQIITSLNAKND